MKRYKSIYEDIKIPLDVGDEILAGKFKNKRMTVKGYGKDEKGQPTVKTNKGEIPLFKFRIAKLMPESISKNEVLDIVRGLTPSQIVKFDFDKLAFGFADDDIIEIPLKSIKIKYKIDMENVTGFNMKNYFNNTPFSQLPPIDVVYEKGRFYISDGHHRYGYAKELKLKNIKVKVESIKDNPIKALGFNSIDEIINLSTKG